MAGLAVVSTWVGYEIGLFAEAADSLGIETTGYAMLFSALPFRFYCVSMLIFVLFTVATYATYDVPTMDNYYETLSRSFEFKAVNPDGSDRSIIEHPSRWDACVPVEADAATPDSEVDENA